MEYNVPGKKVSIGKLLEMAKQDGFEGPNALTDWNKWRRKNGKIPSCTKIDRENNERIAKDAGYANLKEYDKVWLKNLGFDSRSEYQRMYRWDKGINEPSEFNDSCASFFGKHIGENLFGRFLKDNIFEYVKYRSGERDGGIDFICKNPRQEFIDKYPHLKLEIGKEYKIQLKMRCLEICHNSVRWNFDICFNNVDYFILVGWDNRDNLKLMHIWMIHKDEIIRNRKLWRRDMMCITNTANCLEMFDQYEIKDKESSKELGRYVV